MNTLKQLDQRQLTFLADRIMMATRFPFVYEAFTLRHILVAGLIITLATSQGDPRGDSMTVAMEGTSCQFAVKVGGVWVSRVDDAGAPWLDHLMLFKVHEALLVLGYQIGAR